MDALEMLRADHDRVRALFARFEKARKDGDDGEMTTLAEKITEELEVHTAIEEEIFYPRARELTNELAQLLDESLQEHHVVKVLIGELDEVSPGGNEWSAKMSVIIENVEHHAEEEEQDLFPKVRSAADAETLEEIGAALDEKKGALGAPTNADREALTTEQVHELAREQEIPGRSKASVEQLRATIDPRG